MGKIAGKTIFITGASRGIGAATAREFAESGANVVLVARSSVAINELAASIGPSALAIACDISSFTEVEAAMNAAVAKFGSLDVVINNAGVIEPISALATSDPEAWGQAIDINLKGVYYGMRVAMPIMMAAGGGTIINISSGAAHNALEGWSHYCASKAGAAMLTSSAHLEGAGAGLRVMGLSPGTVATEMQREIKASGINAVSLMEWEDHIPPEWVAKAMMWMCSEDSDVFLGQEIKLREEDIRSRIGLTT